MANQNRFAQRLSQYAPSYNRFVELARRALPAMLVFLKTQMGHCTDVGVVNFTALAVCHNRRIHSHKVFKDLAKRGIGFLRFQVACGL